MRLIGILSPSWSGSTLWSLILDGLPGVAGVGEDHWIVDARTFERPYYCTECRDVHPCPVFTDEALERLRASVDFKNWWWTLRSITGCDIIVSSDKGPHHYERFGRPAAVLMPYKDMRAYVTSYIVNWKRRNKSIWDKSGTLMEDVNPTDAEVLEGIPWVVDNYKWCIGWAEQNRIPVVPVALEDLALHPYKTLRCVCQRLCLPLDFSALEFWAKEHHHIGGNFSVAVHHGDDYAKGNHRTYAHQWQEKFKRRITVDDKWKTVLTKEQADIISGDDRVEALRGIFERLANDG